MIFIVVKIATKKRVAVATSLPVRPLSSAAR
jgi:hypothetical protein